MQLKTLATTFSDSAKTHQTVQLASAIGSVKAGQSLLSDRQAPAQALQTALKGMVDGTALDAARADAAAKSPTRKTNAPRCHHIGGDSELKYANNQPVFESTSVPA